MTDCEWILSNRLGYHSWKRLGDMTSSLFALGFHEHTRADKCCPEFLKNIREAAFAFTYSADKDVSIFLVDHHGCTASVVVSITFTPRSITDMPILPIHQGTLDGEQTNLLIIWLFVPVP